MEEVVHEAQSAVSVQALADQIAELAGHLTAADRRWLALIGEFDRREGWAAAGARSCAHWLNWKCGLDLGAAREKLRVAHALETLPLIGGAMERGELSYSKARALTRVAAPATEAYLLSIALHGTAEHVERLVRQYRRVQEAEALSKEARQQESRCLSYFFDDDGSLVLRGRLPAETGAVFIKAMEAVLQQQEDEARATLKAAAADHVSAETSSTSRVPLTRRRADALGLIAESVLAHGLEALSGGERQQIIVHVDAATLQENAPGRCEFEDGPALPAETTRRLACDASVVTVTEDEDGNPLDVGRKTRSIPPALRRALKSRDRGCRFPGCTHQRYIDGHHVQHWAQGGETRLGNLVSLCRFHHRLVHEGGVRIEVRGKDCWRFHLRNGEVLDSAPGFSGDANSHGVGAHWSAVLSDNASHAISIDAETAVSRWRGESIDYGLAIEVLCRQAKAGARMDSPP